MLLSQHGASTLGKSLRRPIVSTMTSDTNPKTPSLTADSMKSARTMMSGARVISPVTRPIIAPQAQRAWLPGRGIIFQPSPRLSIARMGTAAAANVEQEMTIHSMVEDNYIMAPSQTKVNNVKDADQTSTGQDTTKPARGQLEAESQMGPVIKDPAAKPSIDAKANAIEAPDKDSKYDILPENDRSFKMTEELFRAAKDADAESPESYWSHRLYRGPIDEQTKQERSVKVHYCKSKHTMDRILSTYFKDVKVMGFDIEWLQNASKNSVPKKNVSLVQIASEERVALFHLAMFPGKTKEDLVSESLKNLLEDPEVTKVGVSIKGDCTRVKNNLGIEPRGLFELSHLYKLIKFSETKEYKQINKKLISLATQCQEHLHLPMFKGENVRSGNWSVNLSPEQVRYAAADSYAGIQIFETMEAKRMKLEPTPPRPYHAELNMPIRTAEGEEINNDEIVAADVEGVKPEGPETPILVKGKYKKRAVPYPVKDVLDSQESYTEGKTLEEALLNINYTTPTHSRSKSTVSKARVPKGPKQEEPEFIEEPEEESTTSLISAGNVGPKYPEPETAPPSSTTTSSFFQSNLEDKKPSPATAFTNTTPIARPRSWTTNSRSSQTLTPALLPENDASPSITIPSDSPTLLASAEITAHAHINRACTAKPLNVISLRTFFLWHQNPGLSLEQLAHILRRPPLSIQTVTRQILEVASSLDGVVEYGRVRATEALERWKDMGLNSEAWEGLENEVRKASAGGKKPQDAVE
ncbi:hypothetical protein BJ875DRAFT_445 [Amylocarpus encephaloides]|uniref:3'-5' exonuclease domain-containing protein n=1 Tax=Amylocarpus encephaloides TaxID=45428 RepID=A0A9P7YUL0_9HELO|nr:hypothetical protein BJ875DRAFT_445 [Amylocarpus encephaloides]